MAGMFSDWHFAASTRRWEASSLNPRWVTHHSSVRANLRLYCNSSALASFKLPLKARWAKAVKELLADDLTRHRLPKVIQKRMTQRVRHSQPVCPVTTGLTGFRPVSGSRCSHQACTSSKTFTPLSCDYLFTSMYPELDCKRHETGDDVYLGSTCITRLNVCGRPAYLRVSCLGLLPAAAQLNPNGLWHSRDTAWGWRRGAVEDQVHFIPPASWTKLLQHVHSQMRIIQPLPSCRGETMVLASTPIAN